MSVNVSFFFPTVAFLFVVFHGEPDLLDALIQWLTQ